MSTTSTELATKQIEVGLVILRQKCEAIVVRNQGDYVEACELVKTGRAYIKDVGFKLDPGIDSARMHLDFLRSEKNKFVEPAKAVVAIAEGKAEAWKREERAAAQREQDRINAEAKKVRDAEIEKERLAAEAKAKEDREHDVAQIRADLKKGKISKREAEKRLKAAGAIEEAALAGASAAADEAKAAPPPVVAVAPSVPKVAGIKGRVNFKFEVIDASKLPREYMKPDEVKIGEIVRRLKNVKTASALIPGIRVWEEDSI
jgi:hypothetical protein